MHETPMRTLARSVTYRVSAWLLTLGLTYWWTGELGKSTGFSSLLHLILSADYYVHERLWLKVRWGRSSLEGAQKPGLEPTPSRPVMKLQTTEI